MSRWNNRLTNSCKVCSQIHLQDTSSGVGLVLDFVSSGQSVSISDEGQLVFHSDVCATGQTIISSLGEFCFEIQNPTFIPGLFNNLHFQLTSWPQKYLASLLMTVLKLQFQFLGRKVSLLVKQTLRWPLKRFRTKLSQLTNQPALWLRT